MTTTSRKELFRYLLLQVRDRKLSKEEAQRWISAVQPEKSTPDNEPIAVVGMACRFPGAENKEEFWENLLAGRESIGEFPQRRVDDLRRVEPDADVVRRGGYLSSIDEFDAEYFQIPPRSAQQIDPYHRVLMHALVDTMDDAGHPRNDLAGSRTGVFVGNDHTHRLITSYLPFLSEVDFQAITGSWSGILASRLSYHFNLRGPAEVIDTGCSSGLVALDTAVKAIRHGDCDAAFVAAINLFLSPSNLNNETESGDDRVRPFDARANGTVWSEGVGSVLLKPLSQALADNDHIYGLVLGSAINGDGKSNGLTAPSAQAQRDLLLAAWQRSGVEPSTIGYIEAHGTGTGLGDPIELKGLSQAFARSTRRRQFCAIGSVKGNIGHTVGAAGLASLIKTLLCLDRGIIPPSINFSTPNPHFDLTDSPVHIVDQVTEWQTTQADRIAGISSFSLSGTNAHVVLGGAPVVERPQVASDGLHLLPVSGRTPGLVAAHAQRLLTHVTDHPELDPTDLCFTLAAGRDHHEFRAVIPGADLAALRAGLEALASTDGLSSTLVWRSADDVTGLPTEPATAVRDYLAGHRDSLPIPVGRRVPLPAQPLAMVRHWDENVVARSSEPSTTAEPSALRHAAGPVRLDAPEVSLVERVVSGVWTDVLGFEQVSPSDDFFALGGDSISSMKIIQVLNDALGIDLPPTVLLHHPTFIEFVAVLTDEWQITDETVRDAVAGTRPDEPTGASATAPLPLTSPQRAMFLATQVDKNSVAYNVSGMTLSPQAQDWDVLVAALRELAARHESLRSSVHLIGGVPVQVVHDNVEPVVEFHQLPAPPAGTTHREVAAKFMQTFVAPFDLAHAPLWRVACVDFADGVSGLAIDMHHLITDGTSMGIIFRDLAAIMAGEELPHVRPLRSAVRELLARQNEVDLMPQRQYWLDRFADPVAPLELPTDRRRPEAWQSTGARLVTVLDRERLNQLHAVARDHDMTLSMVLLAIVHRLLAATSGQHDIVIGSPVMGRPDLSFQDLVGMFVRTLPVRITADPTQGMNTYLSTVRTSVLDAMAHQDLPLETLIEELQLPRDASRHPLFDVVFVHQNITMALDPTGEETVTFDDQSAKYDLTLSTRETADGLHMEWEYATALFDRATVERWAGRFVALCDRLITSSGEAALSSWSALTEEEEQLIHQAARTDCPAPTDDGVVALFEQQVQAAPDRDAIVMADATWSYRDLDQYANRIAHGLLDRGLGGQRIALLLERSFDMVATMLGVLKAGASYVPLNTSFPVERLTDMAADSSAALVIHDGTNAATAQALGVVACAVSDVLSATDTSPGRPGRADDPMYLMYTSGTTGRPKGSVIRQRGVLRIVDRAWYAGLTADDTTLLISDYSFDGSVYDLYGALLNGGRVVITDRASVLEIPVLADLIVRHRVTTFFITTALFNALVDHAPQSLTGVRRIIFGGETASVDHARRANELLPGVVCNAYGPTETTVFASMYPFTDTVPDPVPIGRPINDTTLWVLDDQQQLCPVGTRGELWIGGRGLADGYLNRPELDAERFQFVPAVGERLYRTGDRAELSADGNFHHRGRTDHQVKIRGYRVEPAEITAVARTVAGVTQAHTAMVASGSHGKALCLWICGGDPAEVRQVLQTRLPDYMVPAFITPTDEIPLNHSDKVDVRRLPQPTAVPITASEVPAPATGLTATEDVIAQVWTECLGRPVTDAEQSFYELGGDSISAIHIVARLNERGIAVEVAHLLEEQTVRALAQRVGGVADLPAAAPARAATAAGKVVPSPAQYTFLTDQANWDQLYNHSLSVTLTEPVDAVTLQRALQELVRHHEALRLSIDADGDLCLRGPEAANLVAIVDAADAAEVQQAVSARGGPLVAAAIMGTDRTELVLAIHHLAVDVVSWGVLLQDLFAAMSGSPVASEAVPFAAWTLDLATWASSGALRAQLPHWRDLARRATGSPLFTDEAPTRANTCERTVTIPAADSVTVLNHARDNWQLGPEELLLLVLSRAIGTWRRCDQVLVAREGHGREAFADGHDTSRTVGWFTSVHPHLVEVHDDVAQMAESLRLGLLEVPTKGFGFLPMMQHDPTLGDERAVLETLSPQVRLNYLGEPSVPGQGVTKLAHLPADVTVDAQHRSGIHLDVVAVRHEHALTVTMRFPSDWESTSLLACWNDAVADVVAAASPEQGFHATSNIADDLLADILGGLDPEALR